MRKIEIYVLIFLAIVLSASKCEYACKKLVSIGNSCNSSYKIQLFQDVSGSQKLKFQVETNDNISILKKSKEQEAIIIYVVVGEESKKIRIPFSECQNVSLSLVVMKSDTTIYNLDFSKEMEPLFINICE